MSNKAITNEVIAHDLTLVFLKTLACSSKEDLFAAYQETYKFFYEELTKTEPVNQKSKDWIC